MISINGTPQIVAPGTFVNNQPAKAVITKVGQNEVFNGTVQQDFRLEFPGVNS